MSVSPDRLRQNRATELVSGGTEAKMTFKDRLCPPSELRVLVTAGASGIGSVIASVFAETGASIHVCDIDDAALAAFQKSFPSGKATRADVADKDQVAAMFFMQREQFGGLDVLVNCAGIAGPTAGIDRIQEEDWNRAIDVNLNGQYRCLHHAVPMLRESRFANVIMHLVGCGPPGLSLAHAIRGHKMGDRGNREIAGHRAWSRQHQG